MRYTKLGKGDPRETQEDRIERKRRKYVEKDTRVKARTPVDNGKGGSVADLHTASLPSSTIANSVFVVDGMHVDNSGT